MKLQLKLYEIADSLTALLDQVDPETGELPQEINEISENFRQKGSGVAAYMLNMQEEINARKRAIAKLNAANKAAENRIASLREYLKVQMARTGINEIRANDASFRVTLFKDRDEYVDVFEEALIADEYMKVIPERKEPDKVSIRKAIKAGREVQGARLATRDRLEIR